MDNRKQFEAVMLDTGITMETVRETVFFDSTEEIPSFKNIFINTFRNFFGGATMTVVTSVDSNPADILWSLLESYNEFEYPSWVDELSESDEQAEHAKIAIDRHEREVRRLLGSQFQKLLDIVTE